MNNIKKAIESAIDKNLYEECEMEVFVKGEDGKDYCVDFRIVPSYKDFNGESVELYGGFVNVEEVVVDMDGDYEDAGFDTKALSEEMTKYYKEVA